MYLKSIAISNFRKFCDEGNKVEFKSSEIQKDGKEFDIAPSTTLIVGKNNCGKTTIVKALEKLSSESEKFNATDFNFSYLKRLLDYYEVNIPKLEEDSDIEKTLETPSLKFEIVIGINDDPKDLITNIAPFMKIEDLEQSELYIKVEVGVKESTIFLENVKELISKSYDENTKFRQFLTLIDNSDLKIKYFNYNNEVVNNFKINKLIKLSSINANNIKSENSLTKAFGTIIKYRHNELFSKEEFDKQKKESIETHIRNINENLTKEIEEKHTEVINESIGKIESPDRLKVHLGLNLTFEKLFNGLVNVEFIEKDNYVPESQFGLGYTNLMMIIAELIEYMEKIPESTSNSCVNLISIEEPETFMHPQMQEQFIKHINEAISVLLDSKQININSQLIITTHSSHILNSKIHSGNTFDFINYVTNMNDYTHVVNLHDDNIIRRKEQNTDKSAEEINKKEEERLDDLNFLKKHIKYKVSELFFSDAIIFVEGVTEEILLKYFIDKCQTLNKYYISIFNIDGAHAFIYHDLIKELKVPCLIITDLDIVRKSDEKETYSQIKSLEGKETTNKTLTKYNSASKQLEKLDKEMIELGNMCVVYQKEVEGYYPTSFEESLILTNYNNPILNFVLAATKPKIYERIVGKGEDINYKNLVENSYEFQVKLSNDKSEFSNRLLYELLKDSTEDIFKLPKYIEDGLKWLSTKLGGER